MKSAPNPSRERGAGEFSRRKHGGHSVITVQNTHPAHTFNNNDWFGYIAMCDNILECSPIPSGAINNKPIKFLNPSGVLLGQQGDALWDIWRKSCEAAGEILEMPGELANELERVTSEIIKPLPGRSAGND